MKKKLNVELYINGKNIRLENNFQLCNIFNNREYEQRRKSKWKYKSF